MSKPKKLSVSLSSSSEVVLDLWKGFSGEPALILSNEEVDQVAYCFPFSVRPKIEEYNNEVDGGCLDLGRALQLGALKITESPTPFSGSSRRKVFLHWAGYRDFEPLYECTRYIAGDDDLYVDFEQGSRELLEIFRGHLISGRQYQIVFSGRTLELWCDFGDTYSIWGAHRLEPSWDLHGLSFSVVAGTPVPKFTMSVSASPLGCSDCGYGQLHISDYHITRAQHSHCQHPARRLPRTLAAGP